MGEINKKMPLECKVLQFQYTINNTKITGDISTTQSLMIINLYRIMETKVVKLTNERSTLLTVVQNQWHI